MKNKPVPVAKGLGCQNKDLVFYSKGLGQLLKRFEVQSFFLKDCFSCSEEKGRSVGGSFPGERGWLCEQGGG